MFVACDVFCVLMTQNQEKVEKVRQAKDINFYWSAVHMKISPTTTSNPELLVRDQTSPYENEREKDPEGKID